MSRCFPFPPPGYEKKTTSDDADLITKEKRKEKRRKKDKKNKDRREGKEKKDEERSKEKSREKKDRKEKKKDKKEKNKDREKNRTLDEKRIEGKRASDNGVEIDDSRIVQELGQRLGDESKVAGIRMFQKVNGQGNKVKARSPENAAIHNPGWMDRRRIEQSSISSTLSEEKWKTIDKSDATSHNWGWVDRRRVVQSNFGDWAEEKGKSNDKNDTGMANGRGNKVEARAPENRTVFNSPWSDQRRTEQNWGEEKGETKDRDDARKANGRGPETAAVHTSVWMDQRRIEGMQVKEEDVEVKENGEHSGRDKKKNKDREKKSKSKDKRRDKKKEKTEKMKGRREKDTKEESKLKGSSQSSIDTQNLKPETLLKENRESIATSGNLGKRKKELEANGRFHENRTQPNKLPRSIPSSSRLVLENGLKSEPEKPGFPFDQKADIKINGSAETRFSNSASTSSSSASVQTIEKCEEEASARLLPHPDTKFLSQILSIPKLEECPDLDDQEWLFSRKNLLSKKMEMETASSGSDRTMQVWAEALPLKSADLSALPYVIPF